MQIKNRSRALHREVIYGISFPGSVDLPPLEAPIFKLRIENRLAVGPVFISYDHGAISDIVLLNKNIEIYTQQCHSLSQQSVLFPKGTIITITNNEKFNLGRVFITFYTYYWEN
jgi:hypothetical protein